MKQNKFLHTLESCWLCLRFPFLYPRNRFTGNHWDSWTIRRYLYGKSAEWTWIKNPETGAYDIKKEIKPKIPGIYDKVFECIPKPNRTYDFETVNRVKSLPFAVWFYIVKFIGEQILPIFHCIPTFTELDAMDDGWRKAFGIQMCKELKAQLKKDKYLYKYRIAQIKEKFGSLCWYDEGASKEVRDIIMKYEDMSWNTCIVCGKPSTKISSGWICPYCDEHFPENSKVYQEKINGKWKTIHEYEMA